MYYRKRAVEWTTSVKGMQSNQKQGSKTQTLNEIIEKHLPDI
jgi:hypothetical protein